MSQALPPDLINPSVPDLNRASDDDVRLTSSEALHRFWKVYETQHDYVSDPSIPRMRNLFWRLWSSHSLAGTISNDRLNQLWRRCRRHDPLVRFQIPLSFSRRYRRPQSPRSSTPRIGPSLPAEGSTEHPSSLQRPVQSGQGNSGTPSTGSTDSSGRPGVRRNTSGSKNRPVVVASGSRGRARPSLPRRKSSQSKSQQPNAPRQLQPAVRSPTLPTTSQESQGQEIEGFRISRTREPAFALPSASSWQSMDDSSPRQPSPIFERQGEQAGSLVDRNFRSRFLSSGTNLSTVARMRKTGSVVRFADEEEEVGMGKDKEVPPPESPTTLQSRGRTGSQVIDSDESGDSDEVRLPRTKSQLSLAIQDRRKQSGSQDLGPQTARSQEAPKSNEGQRREEELLKMGREAAAPQIPRGLRGSGKEGRYRSPSPGPIF